MSGDAVPSSPFLASCYAGELMVKARKSISILAAGVAVLSLSAFVAPAASADDAAVVTSSRSFKGQQSRSIDFLKESTSVSVGDDSSYGGIESLNVPKTKSKAEKEAEAQAKREREAAQQAAEEAERVAAAQQAQSVSRSSARTSNSAAGSSSASSAIKSTSASGSSVLSIAYQYQGVPYVYGGTTPAGFDCSGFTSYVFSQLGVNIGRTDADQYAYGMAHGGATSNPQPGDLMWRPGHVGIYVGNGMMIHAPKPGDVVKVVPVYADFTYFHIV